jgi:replicative DNA helicase
MHEVDDILLLDQNIEDRFLKALLSYERMAPLVMNEFAAENFSTQLKHKLYTTILWHYKEYNSIPETSILLIEIQELHGKQNEVLAERYLEKLETLPTPEWVWIIAKLDTWVKTIKLHKTLFEAADKLKKGDYNAAQEQVIQTIRNAGLVKMAAKNAIDMSMEEIQDVVNEEHSLVAPTRIYALDKVIQGLYRGELFIILAPLNVGKSWAIIHLCVSALLSGKHVLYLTLEMSETRVMQRIIQNVSGTVKQRHQDEYKRQVTIWAEDWETREVIQVPSLLNIKKVAKHMNTLNRFGGKLCLKQYPSGTCTIDTIEKEILLYDAAFGKLPDAVFIDGIRDIKNGGTGTDRQRQAGLAEITRHLRRLGIEYNCAVTVTHQGNRDSINTDIVGAEHSSEALEVMQIADTAISLNQTRAESDLGVMRVFIARARNQQKWQMFKIFQNLTIGQFAQASTLIEREEEEEEDTMQDRIDKRRFQRR